MYLVPKFAPWHWFEREPKGEAGTRHNQSAGGLGSRLLETQAMASWQRQGRKE